MMRGHVAADGTVYGLGEEGASHEFDEVVPVPIGTRYVIDPQNPRRAIPAPPPVPTYAELRAREYPPIDECVVALLEREEGRPEALAALMLEREAVKRKYPKPKE